MSTEKDGVNVTGSQPSDRIVLQRLRNRLMELLERLAVPEVLAASHDDPAELVDDWEFLARLPRPYTPPAYTPRELAAVRRVDDAWDRLERQMPADTDWRRLQQFESSAAWTALVSEAAAAFAVFEERGQLPEDVEVTDDIPD